MPTAHPCDRAPCPAGPPPGCARVDPRPPARVLASGRVVTRTALAAPASTPAWVRCSAARPGRGWIGVRRDASVGRTPSPDPALDSAAARTAPSPSRRAASAASGEVAVSRTGAAPAAAIFGAPGSSAFRLRISIRNDPLAERYHVPTSPIKT